MLPLFLGRWLNSRFSLACSPELHKQLLGGGGDSENLEFNPRMYCTVPIIALVAT